MLLESMIEILNVQFPLLKYSVSEKERAIKIPAQNNEVGGIVIQDDEYEFTVYVGSFTHWHAGCYEENLDEHERIKYISNNVAEFIADLFADEIVMWGSREEGGGFYLKSEKRKSRRRLWFGFGNKRKEYVWSGPISS